MRRARDTCSNAVPRTGLDGEARAERWERSWGTLWWLGGEWNGGVGVVDVLIERVGVVCGVQIGSEVRWQRRGRHATVRGQHQRVHQGRTRMTVVATADIVAEAMRRTRLCCQIECVAICTEAVMTVEQRAVPNSERESKQQLDSLLERVERSPQTSPKTQRS